MNKLKVAYIAVEDLREYARNTRTHSAEQVAQIADSIREFGFTNPVLVDENNVLIAGHGRTEAAKVLGLTEVPAIRLTGLTDAQINALRIADNSLALNAGWDAEMLKVELDALRDVGFDVDLLGLDSLEIDGLDLGDVELSVDSVEEDEAPDVEDVEHRVKRGDIWQLGEHRLMCGDSTSSDDVARLMDGANADMVFTDPPYLLETKGGCKSEIGKALKKQGNDIEFISNFNPDNFLKVLPNVFEKNKINAYVFCNKDLLPKYLNWSVENNYSYNVLVWKKPNAIPIGGSHRPDIEFLLLFRKNAIWNNGLENVNYSRCLEVARETGLHPTMKPIELITNEIKISSNKNSNILDLFGGSGSTLIACEQLKRKCYMMEYEEHYCDVIITRWETLTGRTAKKIS